MALVRHGAAIYATTHSDGCTAVEKCDPYREGYAECYGYLSGNEGRVINGGLIGGGGDIGGIWGVREGGMEGWGRGGVN